MFSRVKSHWYKDSSLVFPFIYKTQLTLNLFSCSFTYPTWCHEPFFMSPWFTVTMFCLLSLVTEDKGGLFNLYLLVTLGCNCVLTFIIFSLTFGYFIFGLFVFDQETLPVTLFVFLTSVNFFSNMFNSDRPYRLHYSDVYYQ